MWPLCSFSHALNASWLQEEIENVEARLNALHGALKEAQAQLADAVATSQAHQRARAAAERAAEAAEDAAGRQQRESEQRMQRAEAAASAAAVQVGGGWGRLLQAAAGGACFNPPCCCTPAACLPARSPGASACRGPLSLASCLLAGGGVSQGAGWGGARA